MIQKELKTPKGMVRPSGRMPPDASGEASLQLTEGFIPYTV
jgi:hypothetical protein